MNKRVFTFVSSLKALYSETSQRRTTVSFQVIDLSHSSLCSKLCMILSAHGFHFSHILCFHYGKCCAGDHESVDAAEITDEDSNDSEHTSDRDVDDIDTGEVYNGVFWAGEKWNVTEDCSRALLPRIETDCCHLWRKKRQRGEDIPRDASVASPSTNEVFVGRTCHPSNTCKCGHVVDTQNVLSSGELMLHTPLGTVIRKTYSYWCPKCACRIQWDPATECIHTIRNGKHGGELVSRC